MTHELEIFWTLQGIDGELRVVRERLARLPARRVEIERGTSEAKTALVAAEERVKSAALAKRKAEQDADALGEQEKKFQLQLSQVKKNDEYAALLHEIEGTKQKRSELETFVLERMEEEGQVASQVARAKEALATAQANAAEEKRVVDGEEAALKAEESAREAKRDSLLAELPQQLRGRYVRIHAAKKGEALAELIAGSCAACGASMPAQTAIEVRRGLNVMECPSCGRILVTRLDAGPTRVTAEFPGNAPWTWEEVKALLQGNGRPASDLTASLSGRSEAAIELYRDDLHHLHVPGFTGGPSRVVIDFLSRQNPRVKCPRCEQLLP